MEHTYLYLEGIWGVKGHYYDEDNFPVPVNGRSEIHHRDGLWINESFMRVSGNEQEEVRNAYEIVPFASDFTVWNSVDRTMGRLIGKYMVVDDTIISTFLSEDGEFSGFECMIKKSDTRYLVRGFIFAGKRKLSSWVLELNSYKLIRGNPGLSLIQ